MVWDMDFHLLCIKLCSHITSTKLSPNVDAEKATCNDNPPNQRFLPMCFLKARDLSVLWVQIDILRTCSAHRDRRLPKTYVLCKRVNVDP